MITPWLENLLSEISQNSQENTCARASSLIKLQTEGCQKDSGTGAFNSEICEISEKTYFTEHLQATASGIME